MSGHSFYKRWKDMKARCHNKNNCCYGRYGGRKIGVCARWSGKDGFLNFQEDMFFSYRKGLSLDRVDNNKGYSPENCRWSDLVVQSNNRRSNRNLTHNGETQSLAMWSKTLGINQNTISSRLKRGWSISKALIITKIDNKRT